MPLAFSVHSLWPFYSWFFHSLGVKTELSTQIVPEGIAKQESNYCFPAEIAHGAIQDVLDKGVDFVFLPHFRDMPSMEDVHACVCPLTQGLPFYARHAFGLRDEQMLRPLVSFSRRIRGEPRAHSRTWQSSSASAAPRGAAPTTPALEQYQRFLAAYRELGRKVLREVRGEPGPRLHRAARPALQRLHARRQHGHPAQVHLAGRHRHPLRHDLRRRTPRSRRTTTGTTASRT